MLEHAASIGHSEAATREICENPRIPVEFFIYLSLVSPAFGSRVAQKGR
jgi:hypothetical protein